MAVILLVIQIAEVLVLNFFDFIDFKNVAYNKIMIAYLAINLCTSIPILISSLKK